MKKISLFILAIMLTITSCKNYDDDFKDLNKSIAELQAQVAGFSAVQSNIVALQASMASLTTAVASIPKTQVDISGLTTGLAAANTSITALQAQLAAIVANYATTGDVAATTAAINLLSDEIALIQTDIAAILASNNVYDGSLTINSAATLAFAQSLGDKVGIINGSLTVNATSLSAAEVSAVTAKILTVTGSVAITAVAELDFSKLASVGTTYSVTGFDVKDDALTSVGTSVTLDYRGPYSQPNLVSAPIVTFIDYGVSGTLAVTSAIDFSGLTTGVVNAGTITVPEATSVKLNAINTGLSTVIAAKALTVDLLAANYKGGLTVSATKAASVITIAGRVDDGAATPAGQALSVTGSATSTLNAAALPRVGNLTVTTIATALSFPALTKAAAVTADATVSFTAPLLAAATTVSAAAATSFSAPLLVASTSVSLAAAKTVSLASTPTLNAAVVETLTFSALASPYPAAATLKTATVTGKVGDAGAFTSTSAVLASATFAGELDAVSVTGGTLLTSLSTTGAIDSFTLDSSPIITSVSLGHSHIAGGLGSVLVITNNAELASLTTSTNYLRTLTVTGNAKLAAMNFASYVNVPTTGVYAISISGNKLSGTFAPAVAATGTTPYVEAVITSADLLTLKPWINAYKTANTSGGVLTEISLTMAVDIDDVDSVTAGNQLLSVKMLANAGVSTVIDDDAAWPDTEAGINLVGEFLLIQ